MSRNSPVYLILLFSSLFFSPGFAAEVSWQQSFDDGLGAAAVTGPPPQMIEGRGRTGKAVVLKGGQALTYDLSGKYNGRRGSLEFWMKPVDLDGKEDKNVYRFLELANGDGKQYVRYEKKKDYDRGTDAWNGQ